MCATFYFTPCAVVIESRSFVDRGTVWGANAVNGVVNIITMNGKATLDGLLTGGAGSGGNVHFLVRYIGFSANISTTGI